MNTVRSWHMLLIGTVLLVGLLSAGVWLHLTAVRSRVRMVKQLQTELDAPSSADDITRLQAEVESMNDQIEVASSFRASDTIHNLTRLLTKLGVRDKLITTSAPNIQGSYEQTNVTVAFSGTLQAAFALISGLANDNRHTVRTQCVEIARPTDEQGDELDVKLQLTVISRKSS